MDKRPNPLQNWYQQNLAQRLQRAKAENLWLIAGLSLAFMPHFVRLPLLITLPSLVLLSWRLLFELAVCALPPRPVRWLLTLIGIAATYVSFGTLVGRQAGVGLLVVMLCLKLMEMNTQRDVGVVIGLGFFVVITVFLFDQSIFMGAYMLLVVSLLVTALVAFSRDQSAVSQWANVKKSGVILAQAAPLALLMFVLFPRIPGPLWNLPSDGSAGGTGISDTMSPGKISQLSDNDSVAFRVQFQGEVPPRDKWYWRGPVLTRFDGKTWSNPYDRKTGAWATAYSQYNVNGEPTAYVVTLEPHQQNWLFALDLPVVLPAESYLSADYEIIANQPVRQLLRYAMRSYVNYQLASDEPPDFITYLQLPSAVGSQARELAQRFRQGAGDQHAIVQRALDYIKQQPFYYTRQPPLLFDDPVDEFLFDSRRGFCEHYASSFVFLMRAAGIPARVVTGYQGGEKNPQSDYFIVRQSDAHAWAEVWLQRDGWVRIDPTTVIPAERIESRQDLVRMQPRSALAGDAPGWALAVWRQLGFSWDRVNHAWNQWVINYNDRRQRDVLSRWLSRLGFAQVDWREMVITLVSGIFIVLLAIGLYLLRPWHRQYHDPAQAAYEQFCRRLARRGVQRQPAEGPVHFSRRAKQQCPAQARIIAKITALYARQRYAPYPTQENLRRLQAAVRRFKC